MQAKENETGLLFVSYINDSVEFSFEDFLKYPNVEKELPDLCSKISETVIAKFVNKYVIPYVFDSNNIDLKLIALEVGLIMTKWGKLSNLDQQNQEFFLFIMDKSYISVIRKSLNDNSLIWYKMFILLLRFCGTTFHQKITVVNGALRVVEDGFKSHTIEAKLNAYDCWMELIDNYSLNLNHMLMPKHLKLLITPLGANLSLNKLVIAKRFQTWIHLIKKLKMNAIICLEKFLLFCFGPFALPTNSKPKKRITFENNENIKVLLEILGHFGHESDDDPCIDCDIDLKLEEPIITKDNFVSYSSLVINSIGEVSILLLNSKNIKQISKVLRCMWLSLLNFFDQLSDSNSADEVLIKINKVILSLVEMADNDENFMDQILIPILELILTFNSKNDDSKLFDPIVSESIKHFCSSKKCYKNKFQDLIKQAFLNKEGKNKVQLFENLCSLFCEYEEPKSIYWLWTYLSTFIPDLLLSSPFNESLQEVLLIYVLWPVEIYESIPENEKQCCLYFWRNTLSMIIKKKSSIQNHNNFQTKLILGFQKLIKKKLEVHLAIPIFLYKLPKDFLKDDKMSTLLINDILQLILDLVKPSLTFSSNKISKLNPIFAACLKYIVNNKDERESLDFGLLFKAVPHFLLAGQINNVLEIIQEALYKHPNLRSIVPPSMKNLITDLTANDSKVSQLANKILSLLNSTGNNELLQHEKLLDNSESLLSPSNSKSNNEKLPEVDNNVHSIELKESRLKNQTPSPNLSLTHNTRYSSNGSLMNNKNQSSYRDNESYELIVSNYKYDKKNLTERQREVFKKRREDIPALYQDLSQSQTDSQSNSKDNSNSCPVVFLRNEKLSKTFNKHEESRKSLKTRGSERLNFLGKLKPKKDDEKTILKTDVQKEEKNLNNVENNEVEEAFNNCEKTSTSKPTNENKQQVENDCKFIAKKKNKRNSRKSWFNDEKINEEKCDEIREIDKKKPKLDGFNILESANGTKGNNPSVDKVISKIDDQNNSPVDVCLKEYVSNDVEQKVVSKVEKELKKLKMDIVGAEMLVSVKGKRKRTSRAEPIDDNWLFLTSCDEKYEIISSSFTKTKKFKNSKPCSNNHSQSSSEELSNTETNKKIAEICNGRLSLEALESQSPPDSEDIIESSQESSEITEKYKESNLLTRNKSKKGDELSSICSSSTESVENSCPDKLLRKDPDQRVKPLAEYEIKICKADTEPVTSQNSIKPKHSFEDNKETRLIDKVNEEVVFCELDNSGSLPDEEENENFLVFASNNNETKDLSSEDKTKSDISQNNQKPSSRSARLIALLTNGNPPSSSEQSSNTSSKQKSDGKNSNDKTVKAFSPKTDRIRKMIKSCEDQRPIKIEDVNEEQEIDLLEFSRVVPSPLATPKGSILKRKKDIDDSSEESLSINKKKRVNFSDPTTTCEKIYIQDQKLGLSKKITKRSLFTINNCKSIEKKNTNSSKSEGAEMLDDVNVDPITKCSEMNAIEKNIFDLITNNPLIITEFEKEKLHLNNKTKIPEIEFEDFVMKYSGRLKKTAENDQNKSKSNKINIIQNLVIEDHKMDTGITQDDLGEYFSKHEKMAIQTNNKVKQNNNFEMKKNTEIEEEKAIESKSSDIIKDDLIGNKMIQKPQNRIEILDNYLIGLDGIVDCNEMKIMEVQELQTKASISEEFEISGKCETININNDNIQINKVDSVGSLSNETFPSHSFEFFEKLVKQMSLTGETKEKFENLLLEKLLCSANKDNPFDSLMDKIADKTSTLSYSYNRSIHFEYYLRLFRKLFSKIPTEDAWKILTICFEEKLK